MKPLDRLIQKIRITKAARYVEEGESVLDIGCFDGNLLKQIQSVISEGVGIDPSIKSETTNQNYSYISDRFPSSKLLNRKFDVITLLAVLEHIPLDAQNDFAAACYQHLNPNGKLIITVPSPQVDVVLNLLMSVGLVDCIKFEEHYGFEQKQTIPLFTRHGFILTKHEKFELGLNNFYLFQKPKKPKDHCVNLEDTFSNPKLAKL